MKRKKSLAAAAVFLAAVVMGLYLVLMIGEKTEADKEPLQAAASDDRQWQLPVCVVSGTDELKTPAPSPENNGIESKEKPFIKPADDEKSPAGSETNIPAQQENDPKNNQHLLKESRHLNRELANFSVTFLGVENGELQMLTVYSINRENAWKSGTVFVPTDALVPGTDLTFNDLYHRETPEAIRQVLEKQMEINIAYFVKVDRNLLLAVEKYIEPIYVGGEKVEIAQLFTREITPADEIILASLLKEITKPQVYFGLLPRLVWTCKQYIETDFKVNCSNLWTHYQIAKNIDTTKVVKKVLPGSYSYRNGRRFMVVDEDYWGSMVYLVTK